MKSLFDSELKILYQKVVAASVGLREIFGLVVRPVPTLKDIGYLNDLILWSQDATDQLELNFYGTELVTCLIPFHDDNGATEPAPAMALMSRNKFDTARVSGNILFNISEATLQLPETSAVKNPRLRGFDFWYTDGTRYGIMPASGWASQTIFRASAALPNQNSALDFMNRPTNLMANRLHIPYLAFMSPVSEIPTFRDLHNVSPIGSWTLRLENGLRVEDPKTPGETHIYNLFIRMKFIYRTAN